MQTLSPVLQAYRQPLKISLIRSSPGPAAMLVGFIVVATEGIGDITATEEASFLSTTGTMHSRRIQGGLLADGVLSSSRR